MGLIDAYPDKYLPRDASLGFRPVITASHASIHAGRHFSAVAYQTGESAMNVFITAPSSNEYHVIAVLESTGPGSWFWSRDPGFTTTGQTTMVAYNHKEESTQTSSLVHKLGGTYVSTGTILDRGVIGATTGAAGREIFGGAGGHDEEWELDQSSIHLLRFVPGASCESVMRIFYYKEDLD